MAIADLIARREREELLRTFPALSMALWRGDVTPAERREIMSQSIARSAYWRRTNAWQYDHPRHCAMVRAYEKETRADGTKTARTMDCGADQAG